MLPSTQAPVPANNEIQVFPNPVTRGQAFTIKAKKAIDGLFQLLNASGQVITAGRMKAAAAQAFTIQVPIQATGACVLLIVDEKTGEKTAFKVIVQ